MIKKPLRKVFTGLCRGELRVHRIAYITENEPPAVSTKQVNKAANTAVLLFKQVNLLHYYIWGPRKKKGTQTAMIIKTPCSTRASNRTLLEKRQVVLCITLLSLHINISLSSHLKMCLFWRKKASDVQHSGTASRGQRSVCCSWPFGAENKFLLVLSMDFTPTILNRTATTLQVKKKINQKSNAGNV